MIPRFILSQQHTRFSLRYVGLWLCLSLTLFFFWPHPPASLLLLVAAAGLAWARLEVAIALLPLTFPYYLYLQPILPSSSLGFSLNELGLIICVGAALGRHIFNPQERQATRIWRHRLWRQARLFLVPAGVFLLGASLAVLVSPDLHISLRAYREEVIEPVLYFLLILRYLRTRDDLARTMGAFLLSAVLGVCIGIIQGLFHITSDLLILNATTFRVNGPYRSPNYLAFLVDRALPVLLALAFLGARRSSSAHVSSQRSIWRDPLRWLCLAAIVPLAWALYWSGSRGGETAVLALLFVFFVFEMRHWVAVLVVTGAGALGGVLFRSRLLQFLNGTGGHGLLSERLLLWKAGLLIIRDHLLLGTGPASFNMLYRPTAPHSYALQALDGQPFPAGYNPNLSHPHNFLLDFWVSTGLLGVVALFWLLGAFVTTLVRAYHLCAPPLRRGRLLQRLLLGIGGSMLVSLVHGLVDNFYFVPDLAMQFWFFLAMVLVIQSIAQRECLALRYRRKRRTIRYTGRGMGEAEQEAQVSSPLGERA